MNVTTQCDDRFSRTKFDFAGTYKMGGGITRQRPLGLRERKLATISWYTEIYLEWACTDVKEETVFWFRSRLLFVLYKLSYERKSKVRSKLSC